ncbi:MAG: hypothetical protein RR263_01720, partial [Oscillospiraceae bacterium]
MSEKKSNEDTLANVKNEGNSTKLFDKIIPEANPASPSVPTATTVSKPPQQHKRNFQRSTTKQQPKQPPKSS